MNTGKWRILAVLLAVMTLASPEVTTEQGSTPLPIMPQRVEEKPDILYFVGDLYSRRTVAITNEVAELMALVLRADPQHTSGVLMGDICNDEEDDGLPICYEKIEKTAWGPLLRELYSLMGNHDNTPVKKTELLAFYYNYLFNTGNRGEGWQVFNRANGKWAIFLLNTEVMWTDASGQLNPTGKRQMDWYEEELEARSKNQCILTAYHRPMYSSGEFASPAWVWRIYRRSIKHGVDFVVTAHEHMFIKFPALWPINDRTAVVNKSYGIEGVGVGTGGAGFHTDPLVDPRFQKRKWGEEIVANKAGITEIKLYKDRLTWEFKPVPSQRDPLVTYPSGIVFCHNNPPGFVE